MRIFHFLTSARYKVGGPARAVIDLCASLSSRGHEVTLATWDGADLPEHWTEGKANIPTVIQVPRPALGGRMYMRPSTGPLADLVENQDLVHVHGMWEIVNVQLCGEAARRGIPYFISVRGMLNDWAMRQGRFKKRVYLALVGDRWLRGACKLHLTAEAELEQASVWFPRSMGRVIPDLLDLEPFVDLPGAERARRAFPSDTGRPRLLFLSRLHRVKGLEVLLNALRMLKDRHIAVCALIAGNGENNYVNSLKQMAVSLGLSNDECRFLGPVTGTMKLSLYQSADLFVLPTSQENFGFVFIEALACRLPVVTTTGADIWPELKASSAAIITDGRAESIVDIVATLLARPDELRRMGTCGRDWVFRDMNPKRIVESFESMYQLANDR
jgi:glycosyltransferase involved in cell wall biosynthesis